MLAILLIFCFAMALLAIFYLRRRELSTTAYLAWGLLAILLPLLGPFLVIAIRPGKLRSSSAPASETHRREIAGR
jgi:hypothetical protein